MKTVLDFLLALQEEVESDKKLNSNHRVKIEITADSLFAEILPSHHGIGERQEEEAKQTELKTVRQAIEYLMDLQKRLALQAIKYDDNAPSSPGLTRKQKRVLDAQPTAVSSSSSQSTSSSSSSTSSTSRFQEVSQQRSASASTQSSLTASPQRVLTLPTDKGLKSIESLDFSAQSKSRAEQFKEKRSNVIKNAKERVEGDETPQGQQVLIESALRSRGIKLKKRIEPPKPKSQLSESATPSQIRKEQKQAEADIATSATSSDAVLERKSRFTILSPAEIEGNRSSTASTSLSSNSSTSDTKTVILAGELPTVPEQKPSKKEERKR